MGLHNHRFLCLSTIVVILPRPASPTSVSYCVCVMTITPSSTKPSRSGREIAEDEAEESDEYEPDEEDDEDEDDEGGEDEDDEASEEGGNGLTALLLGGSTHEEVDQDAGDRVWVPDGGREPAEYSGDEEDDRKSMIKTPEKPTDKNGTNNQGGNGGKKRVREDENVNETRDDKKVKLL
ncbi:hypothetical protein K439DRAFT_593629 [Ramaria rubella]|nr:hypothetical protein K439DRAFT_593629 [Ramaria rubella]